MEDNRTPQERLKDMQSTLHKFRSRLAQKTRQLAKVELRIKGAPEGVVKRRFEFEANAIKSEIDKLALRAENCSRGIACLENTIKLETHCNDKGDLKHNPFAVLRSVKVQ